MKKVGILGATGILGSVFLSHLRHHPWFKIEALAASDKSSGTSLEGYSLRSPKELLDCDLIFSALPSSLAQEYELFYAGSGIPIISSASFHREDSDIPVLIPEINPSHLKALNFQKQNRQWQKGFIVTKPNCSVHSFLIPLAPLHRIFKIKCVAVTTLQAVSGAGSRGLSSQDILDNVIPFIEDEEEKLEKEPLKILGEVKENKIVSDESIKISSQCNRVCVLHGHMACVSVSFEKKPSKEEILKIWSEKNPLRLPSAPLHPVIYQDAIDRPQPRLDRDRDKGMGVTVGRLRECPLLDWRFVALSHNAIRGGAGGAILNAELLLQEGYLD